MASSRLETVIQTLNRIGKSSDTYRKELGLAYLTGEIDSRIPPLHRNYQRISQFLKENHIPEGGVLSQLNREELAALKKMFTDFEVNSKGNDYINKGDASAIHYFFYQYSVFGADYTKKAEFAVKVLNQVDHTLTNYKPPEIIALERSTAKFNKILNTSEAEFEEIEEKIRRREYYANRKGKEFEGTVVVPRKYSVSDIEKSFNEMCDAIKMAHGDNPDRIQREYDNLLANLNKLFKYDSLSKEEYTKLLQSPQLDELRKIIINSYKSKMDEHAKNIKTDVSDEKWATHFKGLHDLLSKTKELSFDRIDPVAYTDYLNVVDDRGRLLIYNIKALASNLSIEKNKRLDQEEKNEMLSEDKKIDIDRTDYVKDLEKLNQLLLEANEILTSPEEKKFLKDISREFLFEYADLIRKAGEAFSLRDQEEAEIVRAAEFARLVDTPLASVERAVKEVKEEFADLLESPQAIKARLDAGKPESGYSEREQNLFLEKLADPTWLLDNPLSSQQLGNLILVDEAKTIAAVEASASAGEPGKNKLNLLVTAVLTASEGFKEEESFSKVVKHADPKLISDAIKALFPNRAYADVDRRLLTLFNSLSDLQKSELLKSIDDPSIKKYFLIQFVNGKVAIEDPRVKKVVSRMAFEDYFTELKALTPEATVSPNSMLSAFFQTGKRLEQLKALTYGGDEDNIKHFFNTLNEINVATLNDNQLQHYSQFILELATSPEVLRVLSVEQFNSLNQKLLKAFESGNWIDTRNWVNRQVDKMYSKEVDFSATVILNFYKNIPEDERYKNKYFEYLINNLVIESKSEAKHRPYLSLLQSDQGSLFVDMFLQTQNITVLKGLELKYKSEIISKITTASPNFSKILPALSLEELSLLNKDTRVGIFKTNLLINNIQDREKLEKLSADFESKDWNSILKTLTNPTKNTLLFVLSRKFDLDKESLAFLKHLTVEIFEKLTIDEIKSLNVKVRLALLSDLDFMDKLKSSFDRGDGVGPKELQAFTSGMNAEDIKKILGQWNPKKTLHERDVELDVIVPDKKIQEQQKKIDDTKLFGMVLLYRDHAEQVIQNIRQGNPKFATSVSEAILKNSSMESPPALVDLLLFGKDKKLNVDSINKFGNQPHFQKHFFSLWKTKVLESGNNEVFKAIFKNSSLMNAIKTESDLGADAINIAFQKAISAGFSLKDFADTFEALNKEKASSSATKDDYASNFILLFKDFIKHKDFQSSSMSAIDKEIFSKLLIASVSTKESPSLHVDATKVLDGIVELYQSSALNRQLMVNVVLEKPELFRNLISQASEGISEKKKDFLFACLNCGASSRSGIPLQDSLVQQMDSLSKDGFKYVKDFAKVLNQYRNEIGPEKVDAVHSKLKERMEVLPKTNPNKSEWKGIINTIKPQLPWYKRLANWFKQLVSSKSSSSSLPSARSSVPAATLPTSSSSSSSASSSSSSSSSSLLTTTAHLDRPTTSTLSATSSLISPSHALDSTSSMLSAISRSHEQIGEEKKDDYVFSPLPADEGTLALEDAIERNKEFKKIEAGALLVKDYFDLLSDYVDVQGEGINDILSLIEDAKESCEKAQEQLKAAEGQQIATMGDTFSQILAARLENTYKCFSLLLKATNPLSLDALRPPIGVANQLLWLKNAKDTVENLLPARYKQIFTKGVLGFFEEAKFAGDETKKDFDRRIKNFKTRRAERIEKYKKLDERRADLAERDSRATPISSSGEYRPTRP